MVLCLIDDMGQGLGRTEIGYRNQILCLGVRKFDPYRYEAVRVFWGMI